jgi:hypothetical protein
VRAARRRLFTGNNESFNEEQVMKKALIIICIILVAGGAGALYYFFFMKNLSGSIVIPYIAHQKPRIDPHYPSAVPIADKLDEVLFDGLFNVCATPSGIIYEDGLGEYIGIDENMVVTVRLKPGRRWHASYAVTMDKNKISVSEKSAVMFVAQDVQFTLKRIQMLGSLSPDYILVSQAIEGFDFTGPDENGEIRFQFRGDREWVENDIKEVLTFKILPSGTEVNAPSYSVGTGPYMLAGEYDDAINFIRNPAGNAVIQNLLLKPYIDNSTYTTELKNRNINTILSTPFGSVSPILMDTGSYFYKSSIATCFFAVFFNFERLDLGQRIELRKVIDNKKIIGRFFKVGTEQQRHIIDYKGNVDNYDDYCNNSVFPKSSYYVEENVVQPLADKGTPDVSVLPDTVRIQTCLNYGFREELASLVEIFNDPAVCGGRIKATAVQNEGIAAGAYDAVIVPVSGYRSNFLFDLYSVYLREPDFASGRINLNTVINAKGEREIDPRTITAAKSFFRMDLSRNSADQDYIQQLMNYVYGFMATHEIGDKQQYAQFVDDLDKEMATASWLFSLPSLAYFRTQFVPSSIDLYGVASQLSTIEKWREQVKK